MFFRKSYQTSGYYIPVKTPVKEIPMWWKYLLVFFCTLGVDVVPLPLPPACTVMIFLQLQFDLPIWPVIIIGVAGSIAGRYLLTLYISSVSEKIFKKEKN